jgi:hypothetical protein
LGMVVCERGDTGRGTALLRQGLAGQRRVFPPGHSRLSSPLRGLGACLTTARRYAEAETALTEARALLADGAGDRDRQARRRVLEDLVRLYDAWGRPEQSEPCRRELAGLP